MAYGKHDHPTKLALVNVRPLIGLFHVNIYIRIYICMKAGRQVGRYVYIYMYMCGQAMLTMLTKSLIRGMPPPAHPVGSRLRREAPLRLAVLFQDASQMAE